MPPVDDVVDYDALAEQFGGKDYVAAPAPNSAPVDYDALAAKFGGTDYVKPPPPKPVDYDALAAKFGGTDYVPEHDRGNAPDYAAMSAKLAENPPGPEYSAFPLIQRRGSPRLPGGSTPELSPALQGGPLDPHFQGPRLPGKEPGPYDAVDAALTNHPYKTGIDAALNLAEPGLGDVSAGTSTVVTGRNAPERVAGARQAIAGGLQAASPLIPAGLMHAPLSTLAAIAVGTGAQVETQAVLEHFGVRPEYAGLAGDVVGLLAGIASGKIRPTSEQLTLIEALRGDDPATAREHTINSIRDQAWRGADPAERQIAVDLLKRKYGITAEPGPGFTAFETVPEDYARAPGDPRAPGEPQQVPRQPVDQTTGQGFSMAGDSDTGITLDPTEPFGQPGPAPSASTPPPEAPVPPAAPSSDVGNPLQGHDFVSDPFSHLPGEAEAPVEPVEPQPTANVDAFKKARAVWFKATEDAIAKFMKDNPGATWDEATQATAGTSGLEPQIEDFKPLPPKPQPPLKPPPPPKATVTSVPMPPTAAEETVPESPETLAIQVQQLGEGKRRVVMFPKGGPQPDLGTLPPGVSITHDEFGNNYAFRRPVKPGEQDFGFPTITNKAIGHAAREDKLTEILGSSDVIDTAGNTHGMGAPDKKVLIASGQPLSTVVVHDANGTEVHSALVNPEHMERALAAAQRLVPPGGTLTLMPPEGVLAARQGEAPAAAQEEVIQSAPPQDQFGSPEPIDDNAIDEGIYKQAVALVREAGKASTSTLQRNLRLGYGAASRILDRMHAEGIIGPANGAGPREVISQEEPAAVEKPFKAPSNAAKQAIIEEVKRRLAESLRPPAAAPPPAESPLGEPAPIDDRPTPAPAAAPQNALADADVAAEKAMRERMAARQARKNDRGILSRPRDLEIDPEDLANLATMGARRMLDGVLEFGDWTREMTGSVGDLIQFVAEESNATPAEVLRLVHEYAREAASAFGVDAPPTPAEAVSLEDAAGTGLEGGGRTDAVRDGGSEALAGVSSEDVPGTGGGEPALQSSDGSGGIDDGTGGEPVTPGPVGGQDSGDSVPPVVSPPGRKGPAKPDIRSVPTPDTGSDYRLTPEEAGRIENGGARTKARNNLEAIRTIKKIQAEGNRPATLDEQAAMAKYVGWGDSELAQGIFQDRREWSGIRQELLDLLTPEEFEAARDSTINAHYTRRDLAAEMWDALAHMGFRTGASVGEPGTGIGNFMMMMPEHLQGNTRRTGIEMDLLTGAMAKALYPGSNIIVKPYQETNLPDNYFDAFIGNVPFQGGIEIYDPAFKRQPYLGKGLHNYFFAKSMTKLRPGGVMLMITSRGTMDSPAAKAFRQWMSKEGELLGAIRLPRDTFKGNAGTSVTADVIAIRKRIPGEQPVSTETWVESKPFDMGDGYSVDMNEYFHRHPEMMMGKMQSGSMYRKGYPELFGTFSLEHFRDLLQTLPADVIPSWNGLKSDSGTLVEAYPDAEFIKDGGFAIHNGQLVRREGGYMQPQTVSAVRLARAKGLIEIRGAAREVLRTQDMDAPEPAILAARQHLNEAYDKFVATTTGGKRWGRIDTVANRLAMGQDPDWPLLASLERVGDTGDVSKADIFSVRTKVKAKPVESTETGHEALAVSLNELGRLDWDRMQQLTGRTPEELIRELEGKIFRNPTTKQWETADEYLSGNVRQKLTDAEFAARENPELNGNVEALRVVQPKDLTPGEIDATLGAVWVPSETYTQFMNELFKGEGATVKLVPLTGGYAIEQPSFFSDKGVANKIEYGTPYFDGLDLFEMAMNGTSPVAKDEVQDFEGKTKIIKNPAATIEAVEKQRRIMNDFATWFWSDPERATTMASKYNLERNNLKLREFNGSHLTFPGLNRTWMRNNDLDPHQKNAVWRGIQSGNTLLAHAVGAGKTLEMVVLAMELKRLGMMRKPMIVVPNHLVGQWRDDFLRAYPSAQILVPTRTSFQKKKRARLMSQVATGNYDAVIVGHKSFELLPVKDETFQDFMAAQIDEVEKAIAAQSEGKTDNEAFKDPTTKQLVRRKKQLEERLKKRANRDTKDNTVTFEELGVDGLFIDEAHAFKNLGYMTMMDRIAGLPNTDANRSVDMLLKSQYITNLHGNNRGLVFATGTPVSNSLAEIWTMMRYLMPQYLEAEGFDQFDAWAKTFGQKVTDMEVAPEGNRMISRTRFSDFVNAPELMNMFRIIADVRTKEQLNLPTPAILGGGETDVVVPASRGLKNYIASLGERADAIRGGQVKPDEDNMLKVSSDGRKASLDMRLVDPMAREDKESKANAAIASILKLYKEFDEHKAAQLVFLDLSTPKAQGRKKKSAVANPDVPEEAPAEDSVAIANEDVPEEEAIPEEELDLYGEREDEEPQDTDTEEEQRERFTVYNQIKQKLMAGGIPENEIAFIHDANTDARKKVLFDAVNAGEVRVLLGSTEKMGAGMNVQQRLIALHHLDAPWRPADWEQRNGRIDRQGNLLWDQHQIPVRIFRYMTEGSFDAFMWQTIVAKARPITRFMNGDPSVRRVQEPAVSVMSAEQAMAVSSGNPEVREKIILDQDIQRIEIMRGAWLNEQAMVNQTLATVPASIRASEALNQSLTEDIATRNGDDSLKVNGTEYHGTDIRKDGAAALVAVLNQLGPVGEVTPIDASYHGFALAATPQTDDLHTFLSQDKEHLYVREVSELGAWLYSEVMNQHPKKTGIGYRRADLELRTLSKKEAEDIHRRAELRLESSTKTDDRLQFGNHRPILIKPNLRIIAQSHNYPATVNYANPAGTIASADHPIRGFEEDLINSQANLRRLEKQKVELESKKGQPFRDEEKLQKMMHRQRELAEKLGEDKDDAQAVAAMDDEENPLAPLLADQTAAMLPAWFPSRKIYLTNRQGGKSPEKVNVINKYLGVNTQKIGHTSRYVVVHIPTGATLRSFGNPSDAVAFARQALNARDWKYEVEPHDIAGWVSDFGSRTFQVPIETPKQSVERLAPKPVEEDAEQRAGPMARYQPLKRKLPTPEFTRGEKGWIYVETGGKRYSVSSTYIIEGELQPVAKSAPIQPDQVAKFLAGNGSEQPVHAKAFSTATVDSKDGRVVWFSNGKPMDGRYYDDIQKKFPGATFAANAEHPERIFVNDKTGRRVGLALFVKPPAVPDSVKALLQPGSDVLSRPRAELMDDRGAASTDKADAAFENLMPGGPNGHVYVNRSATKLIARLLNRADSWGYTFGPTAVARLKQELQKLKTGKTSESAAAGRLLKAIEQAQADREIVTVVDAGPGTSPAEIQHTEREEAFHRRQMELRLAGKGGNTSLSLMKVPEIAEAIGKLRKVRKGYGDEEALIELGAMLGTGQGQEIGLSAPEAAKVYRQYMDALIESHGPDAGTLLKLATPQVRKELGAEYVKARWNGNYKAGNRGIAGRSVDAAGVTEGFAEGRDLSRTPETADTGTSGGESTSALARPRAVDAVVEGTGKFAREDILPKVAAVWNGSRDIVGGLVNFFAPRQGVPTKILDQIYKMNGGREANNFLMASKLDKWSARINKMTQDEMVAFIDRQKTGTAQPDPELTQLSEFMRRTDDTLFREIERYKPSIEYLENHYRVLWKVIPGSPQAKARTAKTGGFSGAFSRRLEGTKGFLKQHTLDDMSEGLKLGGVPYSYNPVRMFQAHYADAMKFITAQRLWDSFKKTGVRKFVKKFRQPPPGYVKLDDNIAKVYFPVPAGTVDAGDWYVEESAARLLNNQLSRDYLREVYADTPASKITGNLGKFMLAVKNNTTAIELGISPFHAVFEGMEAVGSQMGIGMREMWNLGVRGGKPGMLATGLKNVVTSPKAPYAVAKFGSMAKQSFGSYDEMMKTPAGRKWIAANPAARADIPYFFLGGGIMGMPEDFRIKAGEGFKQYLNDVQHGKTPGDRIAAGFSAMIRSIPAFNQAIMSPLFDVFIPNLKLGFFLKEFALAKQEYADRLLSGEKTLQEVARQVVDSVENRFGEMNFDNLYWNRTFKTALQIMFRSVTWKLGNLRANVGAITGQVAEIRRAAKNKEIPLLDMSMGWFLGMSLFTAILGTLITRVVTGKMPKDVKDVIYPVIDAATKMRVSMPTYWRDSVHLYHSPGGYVKSSLAGEVGRAADVWQNKDFYGNEVYNDDDSHLAQAAAIALHFIPAPFAVSSFMQAKDEGGSTVAKTAGFLGFTKAPKYIEQSNAAELAAEYAAKHREVGSRTAYQADRAKAAAGIRNIYRRGGDPREQIREAQRKGLINAKDADSYRDQSHQSSLEGTVRGGRLTMPEMLRVYDAATPEEQKEIFREVKDKVFGARTRAAEWGKPGSETRALAKKYFKTQPLALFGNPEAIQ